MKILFYPYSLLITQCHRILRNRTRARGGKHACYGETFRSGGRATMMQSVTRRKRLSYTRRWCIVVATLFTSVHLQRAYHEHRGCARAVLFLRALSPRETAALSSGLIPAVQATPSLSLHLLPADLRTFRCDQHARRNAEKPGSICTPPALPRLVNILHAVGAGRVLRKGPVRPRPPRCRCHDYLRTRADGNETATREDEKATPYSTV